MSPKKIIFIAFLFLNPQWIQSQISNFREKFVLPTEVKENSGLLFFDDKIITHNDSGDAANLYEIDSLTGNLLRTVLISNATHIDWEDIGEDENNIYIADIGNNNGNRTDLKIYKILKSEFSNNTSVTAEEISFSYEDQTDFSSQPNASNFDAEAIVIYENSILIFTKNWGDLQTNVYKIPITPGDYTATKISTANIDGLITGASLYNDHFLLCGYSTTLVPFLVHIAPNTSSSDDIFSAGFTKDALENELEPGSQVEGIIGFDGGKYYISREHFSISLGGNEIVFSQKLYEFSDARNQVLSTSQHLKETPAFPNPVSEKLHINFNFNTVAVYNSLGIEQMNYQHDKNTIDVSEFSSGIYFVVFRTAKNTTKTLKILKE